VRADRAATAEDEDLVRVCAQASCDPEASKLKIADVTEDDVANLISSMQEAGLAGWTIRGALTPLSRVLSYAARRGLIASNPVMRLERNERPRMQRREMRVLGREEIAKLVDAAPKRYRTLIALSILTGVRQGEALGLRWQDVDLAGRVLRVRWQFGQDSKLAEPKTPQAKREVVLSPALVQMLREHKVASKHSQEEDFVFASHAGTPLQHRNIVRRGLEQATEKAGIGKYIKDEDGKRRWKSAIRWHDLRHTAASLLIASGLDVVYVSRALGHANPSITLRIYAHLWDAAEHAEAARAAMDAALGNLLEASGGDTGRDSHSAGAVISLDEAKLAAGSP
jgi:integrase